MSPSQVFEPTYRAIKERLMRGAWAAGFRLDTARLAVDLGVSKSPVRDSLNRLAGERMINADVGDGFHILRFDEKHLRDMLSFNLQLLLAATVDDGAAAPMVPSAAPDEAAGWAAATLFLQLATASGNDELVQAVRSLNDRLAPVRFHDALVLENPLVELDALGRRPTSTAPTLSVRDLLRQYHSVRMARASDYVRLLERGTSTA